MTRSRQQTDSTRTGIGFNGVKALTAVSQHAFLIEGSRTECRKVMQRLPIQNFRMHAAGCR